MLHLDGYIINSAIERGGGILNLPTVCVSELELTWSGAIGSFNQSEEQLPVDYCVEYWFAKRETDLTRQKNSSCL